MKFLREPETIAVVSDSSPVTAGVWVVDCVYSFFSAPPLPPPDSLLVVHKRWRSDDTFDIWTVGRV